MSQYTPNTPSWAEGRIPGSDCQTFAPLLPLLGEAFAEVLVGWNGTPSVQDVREHLEQCMRCQQVVSMYDTLDVLLCVEMEDSLGSSSHPQSLPHAQTLAPREYSRSADEGAASPPQARRIFSRPISSQRPVGVESHGIGHLRGDSRNHSRKAAVTRLARWLPAAAAILIVGVIGQAIFSSFAAFTPGISRTPAPKWFSWTPSTAADDSATPQAAFAASAHLMMCNQQSTATTQTMQTTWLIASQALGIALITADCGALGQPVALVAIGRDMKGSQDCQKWRALGSVYFGHRPSADAAPPSDAVGHIPTWVHLPQQGYTAGTLETRASPPFSLVFWLFTNQEMLIGRFSGGSERPSSAAAVMVNGQPGWGVTSGRESAIFVPQPRHLGQAGQADSETFVLAGSASVAELQTLAAQIFPRLGEITPKPLDGSTSAPASAPELSC